MPIDFLSRMSPSQVKEAISGFSSEYVKHWATWCRAYEFSSCPTRDAIEEFGSILRKWQATRKLLQKSTFQDR